MPTLVETKIDVTHRLERDGRWETASRFRHRRRQELRETGMSKSEARETAWAEMTERFQPIDEEWRHQIMCAAMIPSLVVPKALTWRYRCAWSSTCQLIGFLGAQDERLPRTDIHDVIDSRLGTELPSGTWRAKGIASEQSLEKLLDIYDPSLLDDLEVELQVAHQSLEGNAPAIAATREELKVVLDAFDLLRVAAKVYWPLPEEL